MTYGGLKLRLTQMFPGISLDLIEGWCNDRYQEIMAELPWTRENVQAVLQTRAPYSTGTVEATQGSSAIALTGGVWQTSMTGLAFRVTGQNDFYEFLYTGPTTGSLDRPFAGPTVTKGAYSIYQTIYQLPSDCRLLEDDAFTSSLGQMTRFTHEQLSASDPTRAMTGTPNAWASYMDDQSVPPNMQVEIWPIPDAATALQYTYQSTGGDLVSESMILQVWLQPSALMEGICARAKAHMKDYAGASFHTALAKSALQTMRGAEAQGMAPAQMQLDRYYSGYRSRRWSR